jgi:hypothetical protein
VTTSKKTKSPVTKKTPRSTAPRSMKTASKTTTRHLTKINDVHPELRAMVNDFLKSKKIGLQVHTMHFVRAAAGDFHCCKVGDHIECGPQCG